MRARHLANALADMARDHPLYDLRRYRAERDNTQSALSSCTTAFGVDLDRQAELKARLDEIEPDIASELNRLRMKAVAAIGCEIHELREIV